MTANPKQEAQASKPQDVEIATWFLAKVDKWCNLDDEDARAGLDAARRIVDEYRRRTGGQHERA